jgi:hypothetical protein
MLHKSPCRLGTRRVFQIHYPKSLETGIASCYNRKSFVEQVALYDSISNVSINGIQLYYVLANDNNVQLNMQLVQIASPETPFSEDDLANLFLASNEQNIFLIPH